MVLKEKDRPRRVLSEIGELQFQRDYYRDRLREEYVIPMDQLLGISAYERLLSSVGAELVHKATEFSYAKSAELVTGGAVTRQTVRNQIGKCRIPKWKPEQEKRAVRELHLFADEDHIPLQRPGKQKGKRNQQVPLVLVTGGLRPISGNRSQTIHPKYFVEETFHTGKLWKEVSGYLSQTYEAGELEKIWVHGDGGGRIQNGLEEFAQTRHVMDGFHWERELKRFSRKFPKKNVKQRIRQVLKKNDKEKAAEILKEVEKTGKNKEEIDRFGKYLIRNRDRIRARQEESIPGSCTEGQVSHVLSERFSRNPAGDSHAGRKSGMAPLKRTEAGRLCQEKIPQELDTALVLPKLAEIVLHQYNQNHTESPRLASTLDEMGVSVININGINFKYFMKLFGNFQNSSGPNIPIYCAGLTDNDPGKDCYPEKNEKVKGKNPIIDAKDEVDQNDWTRLFVSPLKTFEYDLATYNPKVLATALKTIWPSPDGEVCKELDKIIARENNYDDSSILAKDAEYIYKHIESSEIGKGVFAYTLVEKITDDFVVPNYISEAVLWACGGQTL